MLLMPILRGMRQIQHEMIYNTPKFGNDDDYADEQAVTVFEIYYDAVNGRPNSRGGVHRINMLPTTSHVYFGSVLGPHPMAVMPICLFQKVFHLFRE